MRRNTANSTYLRKIVGIRGYLYKNVVISGNMIATMRFMVRIIAPWPTEVRTVFFDDEGLASPYLLRKAAEEGRIRRLAPKLYTADLISDPDEIVTENRWFILGRLIPGAVIVDRSAAEGGRIVDGYLFVATDRRRTPIRLPGLEVQIRTGGPVEAPVEDPLWAEGLRISSPARTLVDNMAVSRGRGRRPSRTLLPSELEDWLARKSLVWGQRRTDRLQEEAVEVAVALGVKDRIEDINSLFGQLAGRVPPRPSAGRYFTAAVKGQAWDERRVEMFRWMADGLVEYSDPDLPEWLPAEESPGELPFFESYFSNYIEGTIFTVNEARHIVETQQPPAARPADGHDILGTYRCVVDPVGRKTVSEHPHEIIAHLRNRHETIMAAGRPEYLPGDWKQAPNQAGGYVFVDPQFVEGTLIKGFELVASVPGGFRRALFMMMVVLEVHPFADGNGRVARVMMNAELSAANLARIVVPSVYRREYLGAIRRVSRSDGREVAGLVRVMSFAWRWTAAMPWEDRAATDGQMEATNALFDPDEAPLGGIRLHLP